MPISLSSANAFLSAFSQCVCTQAYLFVRVSDVARAERKQTYYVNIQIDRLTWACDLATERRLVKLILLLLLLQLMALSAQVLLRMIGMLLLLKWLGLLLEMLLLLQGMVGLLLKMLLLQVVLLLRYRWWLLLPLLLLCRLLVLREALVLKALRFFVHKEFQASQNRIQIKEKQTASICLKTSLARMLGRTCG
jgi:hypothetical protein